MSRGEELPRVEPKPLSPEEKSAIADGALDDVDKFLASKVATGHPSPESALTPVGVPVTTVDTSPSQDADDGQGTGKNLAGRRAKTRAQKKPRPATSVVPPAEVAAKDASVTTATVEKKETAIEEGRYRDHDGVLCDIQKVNGEYHLTFLEGETNGVTLEYQNADELRAFMQDDWQKVADVTLPTVDTKTPADPVTPQASPAIPTIPPISGSPKVSLELVPKEEDLPKEEPVLELVPKEGEIPKGGGLEPGEAEKKQEHLDDLLTMVNEARFQYVTADYKQNSVWKKLKGIFGKNVSEESGDLDTKSTREGYELALTKYYDAKLGNLKASGLSSEEIHKEMGEMLMYLKYNERINLANDTLTIQAENKKFPGKVTDFFENIGKAYNKLTPAQKITLAVTVLGASALIGATGGTAGAAVGAGMMGVRRVIASLGAGVGMDVLTGQGTEYLRRRSATKEHEEEMAELKELNTPFITELGAEQGISAEAFERLGELAKKDILSLDKKFQNQKREKFLRKALVWTTAVGASTFFTYKSFLSGMHGTAGSLDGQAREYNRLHSPAGAASAVEVTPIVGVPGEIPSGSSFSDIASPMEPRPVDTLNLNGVSGVRSENIVTFGGAESGASPMSPIEQARFLEANGVDPNSPVSVESATRVATLREDYTVTVADGRRGLWGVLSDRLPEGMPKADQNRAIANIQALMRKDLALMSQAEQVEAGFAEGKLDLIHKGNVIRFDKFPSLTAERLAAAMDGQSVGAPNVAADVIDRPIGPANGISPIDQTVIDEGGMRESAHGIPVSPMDHAINEETITRLADQPMVASDSTEAVREASLEDHDTHVRQLTDPRQFIIDNPGSKELLFRTTARLHSELLMLTPGEEGVPFQYDYAANGEKLGNTQMSQVLKDFGSIRPRNINLNPLHPDQERALANLFRNATKAFGIEAAQPKAGESATYYIGRMATAALRKGVDIKVLLRH